MALENFSSVKPSGSFPPLYDVYRQYFISSRL
ncbi:hypothetical protein ECTW09195_3003, partial [Escherichia coli TW09195]